MTLIYRCNHFFYKVFFGIGAQPIDSPELELPFFFAHPVNYRSLTLFRKRCRLYFCHVLIRIGRIRWSWDGPNSRFRLNLCVVGSI